MNTLPVHTPSLHCKVATARKTVALAILTTLAACAGTPRVPDWQIQAKSAMDRSVVAYLEGNERIEAAELMLARRQIASTGRTDLLAAAELLHCATRVASLVFEPCARFEALRLDATQDQHVYANYLRGQIIAGDIAQLPPAQRIAKMHTASDPSALRGIDDPLSLLVAAGVLLQTGKANPAVIAQAVDTASAQGWRRPLLAWLTVQEHHARTAGQTDLADRLLRRKAVAAGESHPRHNQENSVQ